MRIASGSSPTISTRPPALWAAWKSWCQQPLITRTRCWTPAWLSARAISRSCHSLAEVSSALRGVRRLDFDLGAEDVPSGWSRLREEARAAFGELNIWRADLTLLSEGRSNGLS